MGPRRVVGPVVRPAARRLRRAPARGRGPARRALRRPGQRVGCASDPPAATSVPNTFQAGQVIGSGQVNQNFTAPAGAIDDPGPEDGRFAVYVRGCRSLIVV